MAKAMKIVVETVLNLEDKNALLNADELMNVKKLSDLDQSCLDGLFRWYRRKQGWRMPLREFKGHDKLLEAKLLEPFSGGGGFEANLRLLTKGEINTVATKNEHRQKYRKNMATLQDRMRADYATNTKALLAQLHRLRDWSDKSRNS